MGNVRKELVVDFLEWREKENRNQNTKEAVTKDFEDFMQTRFQIKPSQNASNEPISIIDILDMMIAPDVDASIAANSARENVLACKKSEQETEPLVDSPAQIVASSATAQNVSTRRPQNGIKMGLMDIAMTIWMQN